MHVFASPELKITLPDGKFYAAVKSTAAGAPFRSITVRDTIGDLPAVENGAGKPTIQVYPTYRTSFTRQVLLFLSCRFMSVE